MEWSFACSGGGVTVRQEGERAVCQAIAPLRSEGLYKAWLRGEGGRALLGTLIPEGGALRLRRTLPIAELRRQGAWPPEAGEILLAYQFETEETPGHGWRWTDCPCRLLEDPLLSGALQGTGRALVKRDMEGFFLAVPYASRCPFPIPPLFCLARLERIGGRWCVVFRFSRQGNPEFLYNPSACGENGDRA